MGNRDEGKGWEGGQVISLCKVSERTFDKKIMKW
jgi:hypothetical protein